MNPVENVPNKEVNPTPNEEFLYLHQMYKDTKAKTPDSSVNEVASQVVKNYASARPQELFGIRNNVKETIIAGIVLKLTPEPHDVRMEELYRVLESKGVYTALKVVEKLNDPHLEDDFHRFLSELVREGHGVKGLKDKTDLGKSVRRALFEIEIPKISSKENIGAPKDLFQKMESIYTTLQGEEKDGESVVLEIANSAGSDSLVFYASVPVAWANRFENQVRSAYPEAKVEEMSDDFNIFSQGGAVSISTASLQESSALPIKTYDTFDHDPMNAIVASFGKLDTNNEGALVQIVFGASSPFFVKETINKKTEIEKGENPKKVLKDRGVFVSVFGTIFEAFSNSKSTKPEEKEKKEMQARQKYGAILEKIDKKIERPVLPVYIRLAVSAKDASRADAIRSDLEASFKQFSEPQGNSFVFKKVKPSEIKKAVRAISFRLSSYGERIYLNTKELATVFHFESAHLSHTPSLKTVKSVTRQAPIGLPQNGTLLGVNGDDISPKYVYLSDEDRLRHLYVIGQTGTGKSTLLKNVVMQDIEKGNGVCFIDPHGSDVEEILSKIPADRLEDVIYFDPSNLEYPMALNMLEYDKRFPEQKTFVVNELFAIFQKLYGAVPESMGPMFEQYFRNATLLAIDDPESGSTLLHVSRVLSDKAYREYKLSKCTNPVVVSFWQNIATKAGGEASLANIVPYITSKFDVFLANDYMRPIVSQEKSSLRFREIMDGKKILLVNLSKGRLGDINSNLLGLIIVGKILMAALSRVDTEASNRNTFNLVIDEFQNVTTDSIATIFSEARKYKLSLTVAHQYIAQLSENISKAVFGNVGTLMTFRVGTDDAEYLEKQFTPIFKANDLANLPNGTAVIKLLANGRPLDPFDIRTYGFQKGQNNISQIKDASAKKYGKERREIEKIIQESFK